MITCGRCGREIPFLFGGITGYRLFEYKVEDGQRYSNRIVLCKSCLCELKRWLKMGGADMQEKTWAPVNFGPIEQEAEKDDLQSLLGEFNSNFGYELVEANEGCDYWRFRRTAEGHIHELIIEDHRWERTERDFNPETDIGDWLIFSSLIDDERDWFGRYIKTQYPLTYLEYKMIEKIIHRIEEERRLNGED